MTAAPTSDALVAALRRPSAYRHAVDEVGFLQTHISWLFFAGPRVYKVKKPVDLGFLDFSTLDLRRHFCEEEVRLNRRLAPHTYLGVVPVTREPDGSLRLDGEGEIVDYAVEMRRLPAGRMLDVLLDRGEIDCERVRELAETLARFHAGAPTGADVDEHGTRAAVSDLVLGNLADLSPFVGETDADAPTGLAVAGPDLQRFLETSLSAFLERHARLFDRRVARGRVRDGHGDLHAGNICCTEGGLVIYDCIEFSERFRCGDVANDLAFLAMDLDRRGFFAFSRELVERYAAAAGDAGVGWLMGFYKTHRALVRAKVAAITAIDDDTDDVQRDELAVSARRYVQLAVTYRLPPLLLLTCGLPATGKSWLARELGRRLGAAVLRSDVVRKRRAGVAPTERVAAQEAGSVYGADETDAVYRDLSRDAVAMLARGRSVVVDATFAARRHRRRFLDVATRLEHPVAVVEVTCPEDVVRERMRRRRGDAAEVSDADLAVYRTMRERFEPCDEESAELHHVEHASGGPVEPTLGRLLECCVRQVGGAGTAARGWYKVSDSGPAR